MAELIYRSERKFTLFSYDTSHGLLLLRSGKSVTEATRLDVLFRDVRAIELRVFMDGITITKQNISAIAASRSRPEGVLEHGLICYVLEAKDWSGFVIAGGVTTAEDRRDFFEASPLL